MLAALPGARAQERTPEQVVVTAPRLDDDAPFAARAGRGALERARGASSDSARLLQDIPGVSLYGAGGVSSLPAIHGLADDRLRTQIDGMDLVAACPNHMNSALSYIDPSRVAAVKVWAGITPVSVGGDSIGGTIQIESAPPAFADGDEARVSAQLGGFVRSNGNGRGGSAVASRAAQDWLLRYSGASSAQDNYRAARAFKPAAAGTEGGAPIPGDEVASSAFDSRNQDIGVAFRHDGHLLQLDVGIQRIGFEGFPNQRMDMTSNRSTQTNLRYSGTYGWGTLEARAWQQKVEHRMDMGPDRYHYGFGMPMNTEATTQGAQLGATLALGEADRLRLGAERQTYVLYDWWPPVGGAMGPNAFWNIDDGWRNRTEAYAEWETRRGDWTAQAGVRGGRVVSDTGPVQGYDNGLGATWGNEAAAFNGADHRRSDRHLDLALLARYTPDTNTAYEAGFARKTHSPNLYQRYPWSTQPMAALMNNFVGDGNGYVGNPDLRPEVAHTLAFSAERHGDERDDWELRATAYLTEVHDFIDARRCTFGQCSAANASARNAFVLLQYANTDARLSGLDFSGRLRLLRSQTLGDVSGSLVLGIVRGRDRTSGDKLYNIMPANAKLVLQLQRGAFGATAELVAVAAKRDVSQVRNEMPTAGYGLVNLRASYEWAQARLDLGVENAADRFYTPPLGGAYLGQGPSMTSAGIPWGVPVPGMGRSFNVTFNLSY